MRIYDTMSNTIRDLKPKDPSKVSIYACGPTVQDVPHLGHARTALTYDVLKRYLVWAGFEVFLVSNITDIDDKIINRALDEGISEEELAQKYANIHIEQLRNFGIKDPDERPRATQFIREMISIIEELMENGSAYEIEGSGIYFDVSAFEGYGALVNRSVEELRDSAKARIDADMDKSDPLDFALWKTAKPGEPTWDSPWGLGRPGWHIECVAMSLNLLGEGFDIHGGGSDLTFPHHENERVECEAAGYSFATHWMHSGMLNVSGEMELSEETMAGAAGGIERIDAFFRRMDAAKITAGIADDDIKKRFSEAMDNDLGTPDALAVIFESINAGNALLDSQDIEGAQNALATVTELLEVLGLDQVEKDSDEEIEQLIQQREIARQGKNFEEADRIRDQLHSQGIEIEDTPSGTLWRFR